jgi:hypothetical protein
MECGHVATSVAMTTISYATIVVVSILPHPGASTTSSS